MLKHSFFQKLFSIVKEGKSLPLVLHQRCTSEIIVPKSVGLVKLLYLVQKHFYVIIKTKYYLLSDRHFMVKHFRPTCFNNKTEKNRNIRVITILNISIKLIKFTDPMTQILICDYCQFELFYDSIIGYF